jgi:hypothetical protein
MQEQPQDRDAAALAAALSRRSAWDAGRVAAFLHETRLPLRLATLDADGFPHVTSLWTLLADGALWCCTQRSALVCRHLARESRVGFEYAVGDPPYRGVSGQGRAALADGDAAALLGRLADRYLEDRDPGLRRWLLSRVATEVIVRIEPLRLTSWDFGRRMSPAGGGAG